MAVLGINEFTRKEYKTFAFADEWLASFGEPEKNFRALIYGEPGNGKTEFCIKLAKYMASFTKVYYNSYEQGFSKSLQDALKRNRMYEVNGKVIFANGESLEDMIERLGKRNSPSVVIIDSRDYMDLTNKQLQKLIDLFPHKSFIIICWEVAKKPAGAYAKKMLFMVDVKIRVKDFKAQFRSRFGGNEDFVIWDKGAKRNVEPDLFNAPAVEETEIENA